MYILYTHHSPFFSRSHYLIWSLHCVLCPHCTNENWKKNSLTQRDTYTNIQNNCCAITLSVLFHFLEPILKLYDRNFSAGQPINVRVLILVLEYVYRTVCVCLYVRWIYFMRNHKINRNWFVFRGVQIKMAWKYMLSISFKSCSRNQIHAKLY